LTNPIHYFSLLITENILNDVIGFANKKARTKEAIDTFRTIRHRKRLQKITKSHSKPWKDLDLTETKAYFGILILMGIVTKPTLKDYWTTSTLFETPGVMKIMSRDRFLQISKYINFYDPENIDVTDPLHKISCFIQHVIVNSQLLYYPEQNLTIDEAMISFRGRSSMKVYMPLKPIKFGFKAYLLCEASTGYVLAWSMHTGKKKVGDAISEIVSTLCEGYEGESYHIYMDRFYTTTRVFNELRSKGI